MPTEIPDPAYVPLAAGGAGGSAPLEVADQAARLALTGAASRSVVAQLDDDSVWLLESAGTPSNAADWTLIGRRSIRFLGTVASQAAMLALSAARKGDWCFRSDLNRRFDFTGTNPATLAHWTAELEKGVADIGGLVAALAAKESITSQVLTPASPVLWDAALGKIATLTLDNNRTLGNPTNLTAGRYVLRVIQDATGGRLLSFGLNYKFPFGANVLQSAPNSETVLEFVCTGDSILRCVSKPITGTVNLTAEQRIMATGNISAALATGIGVPELDAGESPPRYVAGSTFQFLRGSTPEDEDAEIRLDVGVSAIVFNDSPWPHNLIVKGNDAGTRIVVPPGRIGFAWQCEEADGQPSGGFLFPQGSEEELAKVAEVALKADKSVALMADGTRLGVAGAFIAGARHSLGITRIANGDYVLGSNCDMVINGITGGVDVDPNVRWLPFDDWYYDRPTWRIPGRSALDWKIYRTETGYWEILLDGTVAFRGQTQWLEFPWEETAWTQFAGYTGPPVLAPYEFQEREMIPPDLLPRERVYPLLDAATITPNFAAAKVFTLTLGGNRTLANPVNVAPGGYLLRVKQDGAGGRTLAFGSRYRFSAGAPPVLTAAAGAEDILSIVSFGGDELYVAANLNMTAP